MTAPEAPESSGCFSTTQWTQVIDVIQKGDQQQAQRALAAFCDQYRRVIYHFIRRRGYTHEQTEDLLHQFLETRILQSWDQRNTFLHEARRQPGRQFRGLLCQVLLWFLADAYDRKNRLKRGGTAVHESIEELQAAGQSIAGAAGGDPGREFDRLFAQSLIEKVCQGQNHSLQQMDLLMGKKSQSEVAAELGMSENAVKQAHFRFRQRLGQSIRAEVRKTVGEDEAEIRNEIAYLMSLF